MQYINLMYFYFHITKDTMKLNIYAASLRIPLLRQHNISQLMQTQQVNNALLLENLRFQANMHPRLGLI